MNNNNFHQSQNMCKPQIESPIQYSQNLNYCIYIMPNKTQFYNVPYYNYYPIYPMTYIANPQPTLMNMNNEKNENQSFFNFYYNNIYPVNAFDYNRTIISPVNNQLNFGPTTPAPPPQEIYFLNKKRSNPMSNDNEKHNEIINQVKREEKPIQSEEIAKMTDINDLENKDTKTNSSELNIIKDNNIEVKSENKSEKNEGDNVTLSSACDEQNKEEKKEEKKKKTKKKRNYAELLQDTFLEHIGEPKKKISIYEKEEPKINRKTNTNRPDIKNKSKSKSVVLPTKLSESKDKLTQAPNIKDKNKKLKIKPLRTQKKKPEHKITLKNNKDILADLEKNKTKEKSESNPKLTKVIFHGENYENTKSTIDFMKYNFDFSIEEQYKTKKLITDYDQQHIDLIKINEGFYDNYNSNSHNLENTEQKWSRKKFGGDNKELKKAINLIRDSFQGRKIDTNEEKCLNILKNNDYNIDEFLKSKINN